MEKIGFPQILNKNHGPGKLKDTPESVRKIMMNLEDLFQKKKNSIHARNAIRPLTKALTGMPTSKKGI